MLFHKRLQTVSGCASVTGMLIFQHNNHPANGYRRTGQRRPARTSPPHDVAEKHQTYDRFLHHPCVILVNQDKQKASPPELLRVPLRLCTQVPGNASYLAITTKAPIVTWRSSPGIHLLFWKNRPPQIAP